jgi:prophage antirepressor-like protein
MERKENTKDEKLMNTIYSSGQGREMWFLTEDELYEVLMQSRKPIAKAFKKEVKEILKTIRKKGVYATNNFIDEAIDNPDFAIKVLTELKEERNARKLAETNLKVATDYIRRQGEIDAYDLAKRYKILSSERKYHQTFIAQYLKSKNCKCREYSKSLSGTTNRYANGCYYFDEIEADKLLKELMTNRNWGQKNITTINKRNYTWY